MTGKAWLTTSDRRMFPSTLPSRAASGCMEAARNERFSFQVGLRRDDARARVAVKAEAPPNWSVRVRRVGYVPIRHPNPPLEVPAVDRDGRGRIPGFVPDPLFDESEMLLPQDETHAFWISVTPSPGTDPGTYRLEVRVSFENGGETTLRQDVRIHDLVIEPRKNFDVTHWFYADALIDWYGTDLFDRRFWDVAEKYMRNVAEHGQNTLYVPVFTPPLDGVKRPSQLLRVSRKTRNNYSFDWQDVRRYIRSARRQGLEKFEWCHPFTQWGAANAIRVYEGQGRDEKLLWPADTGALSDTYRRFLAQYLPELRNFLRREGILNRSFFHVSDEPHGEAMRENYRADRALLADLAPWMKVMDALTEIDYAREGLTDMPVPSISKALDFVDEKIPCWCYYCCGPRGRFLNRLLDTPLAKIAMHGFLFYRWPVKGFLHWGYNYWYRSQTRSLIDPYSLQDGGHWAGGWAYGDPFVVYPGENGPVDSIRWEVFGESLQDYALLQTLNVERNDSLLQPIRSFESFPKTASWRAKTKAGLYRRRRGSKK